MRFRALAVCSSGSCLLLTAGAALAAPQLRVQVDQRGDFALIGNTLAQECSAGAPAPVVGSLGSCGTAGTNDTAPDVFWRSDSPSDGQATAGTQITVGYARSTSVLQIPSGASVTHAWLYWGATNTSAKADTSCTLERPGLFSETIQAAGSWIAPGNAYQSRADVTTIVRQLGNGPYRVGGLEVVNPINLDNPDLFAGWWMVVLYELASEPPRNLAVFDGLDRVSNGTPQNITLSGFLVPQGNFGARLGLVAFEGDHLLPGDRFFFNPSIPHAPLESEALFDPLNPADNFFNSTRSSIGVPVSTAGDLPQLSGTPASMSGIDIDVVDVTSKLAHGATSAPIRASSTGDVYLLAGFVTSISTFRPDLSQTTKTWTDLDGGHLLPGDLIEYAIEVRNTGNDTAVGVVLSDVLPVGLSLVPHSIQITSGANAGAKTDAVGDDQVDYDAATRTLTARLGAGADGALGGAIAADGVSRLTFRVALDANSPTTISNQATVRAAGEQGTPARDFLSDGNGAEPGAPPTTFLVDKCYSDADCTAPIAHCDTAISPHVCVGCLEPSHCGGATPVCAPSKTCEPCAQNADCLDPAHPVCATSGPVPGACVECSSNDASLCSGAKPLCLENLGFCGCTEVDGDAECGSSDSGWVCNGVAGACVPGCAILAGRNGCPPTQTCSDQTGAIGTCVDEPCITDADCTGAPLVRCNTAVQPNACVQCLTDEDCAAPLICDQTGSNTCVECTGALTDNCKASGSGALCLANQTCGCAVDSDCGALDSGRVCDGISSRCAVGCRASDGNSCPSGFVCSATGEEIGTCEPEPDAGAGGAAGQGGAAGSSGGGGAGSAGAPASGGAAGSAGTGGSGGTAGIAGNAGEAGAAGAAAATGSGGATHQGGSKADAGSVLGTPEDDLGGGGVNCAVSAPNRPSGPITWLSVIALLGLRIRRRLHPLR